MAASSVIIVNRNAVATLLEDVPATIEFDDEGIVAGELNYTVIWDAASALVSLLKYHPDYPFLKRDRATITRIEGTLSKVKVTFKGVGEDETTTYSVVGATSTDPIETHSKFVDFAGKWNDVSTWSNGARFAGKGDKDQGRFLGFAPLGQVSGTRAKAGVRSYLNGSMVFREVITYKEDADGNIKADMAKLGYIDEPPNVGRFVDIEAGRDWLFITCNMEQVGDGAKATREWVLSGPNGWDPDIYTQ